MLLLLLLFVAVVINENSSSLSCRVIEEVCHYKIQNVCVTNSLECNNTKIQCTSIYEFYNC